MIARNDSTPIVVPRQCTNPAFLGDFSRDVISAIKGLRDRRVIYNAPTKAQSTDEHPFKLTARTDNESNNVKYQVSSNLSTITDGTNGPSVDLTAAGLDTEYSITQTSYVFLESNVDSDLVVTNWNIVDSADIEDAKEIETSGSPIEQAYLRLLIGVVEVDTTGGTNKLVRVYQNTNTAQRIAYDFFNGALVKILMPCFIHASYRKE
jgi:hypothetical protein